MTDNEIMKLPSKPQSYVKESDISLGSTAGHSYSHDSDRICDRQIWYNAYRRPSTDEAFKVREVDGQ